jgi:hypothetical protein
MTVTQIPRHLQRKMQSPIHQEPPALLVVGAEEKGELTPASRQEHLYMEAEKKRRLEVVAKAVRLLKRMLSSKRYGDDAELLQARDDVAYALELSGAAHAAEEFEEKIAAFTERVNRVLS